ncbi:hypothetical protein JW865_00080, partial [Candidatus Bathyarchaeota archaeon]|nr:hypothetical protein [Candidatus Bathyarchaeota archaeon]
MMTEINVQKNLEKLNLLFDNYLKPFKNKNIRLILYLLVHIGNDYFTSHDIQTLLNKYNVKLNKKEINGLLTTMQKNGLINKSEERGKPTIMKYSNKYTFGKWYITTESILIIKNIINILNDTNMDTINEISNESIQEININFYKIKLLKLIYENNNIFEIKKFIKKFDIDNELLNSILDSDSKEINKLFYKKVNFV